MLKKPSMKSKTAIGASSRVTGADLHSFHAQSRLGCCWPFIVMERRAF